MSEFFKTHSDTDPLAFLAGGGEMGRLIRSMDWSKTSLGPMASWPQSLRSAVSILLPSKAQIAMFWGPELITLYNDAYRPVLGTKHPRALGLPIRETWSELWGAGLRELFEGVLATGEAFWASDRPFFMERFGFTEETFFDISYDPIRDESGRVGGLFCIVSDTTARVVGERRLQTLRELSASVATQVTSVEEACRSAVRVLARNSHDVPFALIYLVEGHGHGVRLVGAAGLKEGSPAAPIHVEPANSEETAWPLLPVLLSNRRHEVTAIPSRLGALPGGAWPESPHTAVVLPISTPGQERPTGVLVAGVSPRRPLDDAYRGFYDLLANQIATIIANARAYEEEKRRAEALAELDRAKTAFFSNVSHEFRTPLTLMLGPVEDMLAKPAEQVLPDNRELLEVVHRNGLRLQRLVNTLLDFSRIEAGRIKAVFEPTDLGAFTADLASNFRSACAKAGLEFEVHCPPLPEPVYLDRGMWEKVVLNLLSNAFKFTFEGKLAVHLRQAGATAELRVSDTGTGIPAEEMPRLFERFHRIENARGRTHEGSGIGLALVHELVKLHGGSITAASEIGKGTTITVALPLGADHLPRDQIGAGRSLAMASPAAGPFVEEAMRWLPDNAEQNAASDISGRPGDVDSARAAPVDGERRRVLVVDDNADMRQYVVRMLSHRYRVDAASDGEEALATVRRQAPDLILADVMMPRLDGFGLLERLRADARTAVIPVILLSARAGEESRIEGMQAGADDYLVKPFSARELLARVDAHLKVAQLRSEASEAVRKSEQSLRESEARLRSVIEQLPAGVGVMDRGGSWTLTNSLMDRYFPKDDSSPLSDRTTRWRAWDERGNPMPPEEWPGRRALRGEPVVPGLEMLYTDDAGREQWTRVSAAPLRDASGGILGAAAIVQDISNLKHTEEELRRHAETFVALVEQSPLGIFTVDSQFRICNVSAGAMPAFRNVQPLIGRDFAEAVRIIWPEPFATEVIRIFRRTLDTGEPYVSPGITERRFDLGAIESYEWQINRVTLADGQNGVVCYYFDATRLNQANQAVRTSEERFRMMANTTPAIVWTADPAGNITYHNQRWLDYTGIDPSDNQHDWPRLVLHPDDYDRCLREWTQALQTGNEYEIEVRNRRRDGEYRWFLTRATPVRDGHGRVVEWYGSTTDIHDQKQAEAVVRKHGERFRLLWEAAAVLLSTEDPDAMLRGLFAKIGPHLQLDTYFNFLVDESGQALRLASCTGIPEDAIRRLARLEFGQAICGTAARIRQPIVATHIQQSDDPKAQLVRSFGIRVYACNPLIAKGRLLGTLSFASRSRDEFDPDELDFLRTICHYVTVAYDRLRLVEELKETDRRKDEFLATLAHELRNPLAPLRNGLQVMKLARGNADAAEQSRAMMERQLGQMVRLIDDLLDVSRISRGKITLQRQRVELASVVQQAVETSRPLIDANQHQLSVSVSSEPIYVDADVTRLAQVFSNLLNNAAKYTEPGGNITLRIERQGSDAVVSVRDTGVGIPQHLLPTVFQMFTQVDRSLERSQGGLGIGLSIVKRLTEMHGGSVEAKSDGHGMGSEFLVRLPVVLTMAAGRNDDAAAETPVTLRRRILVVDDNRDAAASLAMLLRLTGNETRTAHDGVEALEAAAAFRPDLIMLDIGMPRLNGYDTARRIREQTWGRDMILIALTGWGQDEDRRRSQEAGFNAHITKPVDPEVLDKLLAGSYADSA